MTSRDRWRATATAVLSAGAAACASADAGTPERARPPGLLAFELLFGVIAVVVLWKFIGEFRKIGAGARRIAAARRRLGALRADVATGQAALRARRAQAEHADRVLTVARRQALLIEALVAFVRDVPTWESPEAALPKIEAFRRATADAPALLCHEASQCFRDAADRAVELLAQRRRLRQGQPASDRAGPHGSVADLLRWLEQAAASVEQELSSHMASLEGQGRDA